MTPGSLEAIAAAGDVLVYERNDGPTRLMILLNLGHDEQVLPTGRANVLLSTYLDRS